MIRGKKRKGEALGAYLAGPSITDAATNVNYLIPVDAQRTGAETFWTRASIWTMC